MSVEYKHSLLSQVITEIQFYQNTQLIGKMLTTHSKHTVIGYEVYLYITIKKHILQ